MICHALLSMQYTHSGSHRLSELKCFRCWINPDWRNLREREHLDAISPREPFLVAVLTCTQSIVMEETAYQSPPASTIQVSVLPRACSRLKRYRGSPQDKLLFSQKKVPARLLCSARKRLDFSTLQERRGPLEWSKEENAALVEFLCLHNPKRWPLTKDPKFWRATAVFVQQRSGSGTERPRKSQMTLQCLYVIILQLYTIKNQLLQLLLVVLVYLSSFAVSSVLLRKQMCTSRKNLVDHGTCHSLKWSIVDCRLHSLTTTQLQLRQNKAQRILRMRLYPSLALYRKQNTSMQLVGF